MLAAALGAVGVTSPVSANGDPAVMITVNDATGNPVAGAVVAVKASGGAERAGMTNAVGQVMLYRSGGSGLVISAPGFVTATTTVGATTAVLARTQATDLAYANSFGAQVRSVAADASSGVMYATLRAMRGCSGTVVRLWCQRTR